MKKRKQEEHQVIATTLLQSRKLIDAGLSAVTADMRWNLSVTYEGEPILESLPVTKGDLRYDSGSKGHYRLKPAWSLGKLMQISGVVLKCPDRPDLIIAALTNVICAQLKNGGGVISNLNIGRTEA